MLGCPHAIQKDQRDKIRCTQTAGLCGHVYYCQLYCKWKQSRGAETCALINKPAEEAKAAKLDEAPAARPEAEPIRTADDKKAAKRRKAKKV